MVNHETDTEEFEGTEAGHTGRGAIVTTAIVAAAVGAGVAMLFAPEKGTKTRKKLGRKLFTYSSAYLFVIFLAFILDHALRLGGLI